MNYVDIFEGKRDLRSRKKHYCGSVADPVTTDGNKMYFRFFGLPKTLKTTEFLAWFTAYRDMMQESKLCEDRFLQTILIQNV